MLGESYRVVRLALAALLVSSVSATPQSSSSISSSNVPKCRSEPTTQHLSDPPYENYFYSDCHVDAQAVVTSPLPDSNLSVVSPRVIVAWPGGNSGVCAFFDPQNGKNGSLAIKLVNFTSKQPLQPVYVAATDSAYPRAGVSGIIAFNSSSVLSVAILGSIRTIRDFTEGPSLLVPQIQDAVQIHTRPGGGAVLSRQWLDNVTTTELGFIPIESSKTAAVTVDQKKLKFAPGEYLFYANYNYPQLTQLNASTVLDKASQDLITTESDQAMSLSFLSYRGKLLAGVWRFLTYFGRDSMIAALLLQPVLSDTALEAVIGSVLERLNSTDGNAAHEETIG